jgi:hypothetical protein
VIPISRGRKKSPFIKLSDLPELRKKVKKIKQRKSGVYGRKKGK